MKEIEKMLDIGETPKVAQDVQIIDTKSEIEINEEQDQIAQDFDLVRDNIISVIQKANENVAMAIQIAAEKEDARSFEIINQFLTTINSSGMSLLDAHKKKQELLKKNTKSAEAPTIGQVTNNNIDKAVFVGTTSDLKKMIKNMSSEEPKE